MFPWWRTNFSPNWWKTASESEAVIRLSSVVRPTRVRNLELLNVQQRLTGETAYREEHQLSFLLKPQFVQFPTLSKIMWQTQTDADVWMSFFNNLSSASKILKHKSGQIRLTSSACVYTMSTKCEKLHFYLIYERWPFYKLLCWMTFGSFTHKQQLSVDISAFKFVAEVLSRQSLIYHHLSGTEQRDHHSLELCLRPLDGRKFNIHWIIFWSHHCQNTFSLSLCFNIVIWHAVILKYWL